MTGDQVYRSEPLDAPLNTDRWVQLVPPRNKRPHPLRNRKGVWITKTRIGIGINVFEFLGRPGFVTLVQHAFSLGIRAHTGDKAERRYRLMAGRGTGDNTTHWYIPIESKSPLRQLLRSGHYPDVDLRSETLIPTVVVLDVVLSLPAQ